MEKLSLLEMEEVQGKSNGQEPFKLCAAASTMIRVYSVIYNHDGFLAAVAIYQSNGCVSL
jgi:hypothetical protein